MTPLQQKCKELAAWHREHDEYLRNKSQFKTWPQQSAQTADLLEQIANAPSVIGAVGRNVVVGAGQFVLIFKEST